MGIIQVRRTASSRTESWRKRWRHQGRGKNMAEGIQVLHFRGLHLLAAAVRDRVSLE